MMAKLPYEKYIITDTREYSKEEMKMIEKFREEHPFKSTVGMTRLLWMDDEKVKGAEFYMEVTWLWPGKTPQGTMEEPHVHNFPEVIGFIGSDQKHPGELGGRMEMHIGDEVHDITKSSLIYLPPGLHHCPLTFREVTKPTMFFTLAPVSKYGRKSEQMNPEATKDVQIPEFKTPRKGKDGTRYGRYIITQPISHIPKNAKGKPAPQPPKGLKTYHAVSLDGSIIPGAFYVDFVWIFKGSLEMAKETHAHDWDEMIGLCGLPESQENPRGIDPGVSVKLGNDMYKMKKSSLIYVPKNVPHAPILFENIEKPVLCFTIGTAPKWTMQKKKAKK
jgi:mannose-6-phosphate isomerase-like protein (cupin superfamily)